MNRASNIYNENFGTDKEIIKRIKSNDPDIIDLGYESLYNKYSKLAYVCIKNIVHSNDACEDLLADTFLKIFEYRANLLEEKNLKFYIVTTAKNIALNYVTKKRLEVVNVDEIFLDDFESNTNELQSMIDELKLVLDEIELKIIINHLVYAFTFEEISSHLNIPTNTVKTTYYRAIKKVK